jgi:superfamily II DNA or RNA helicase
MNPFAGARPYQIPHIQSLLRALLYCQAALDASDTGTGKTYCTMIVARILGVVPLVLGPRAVRREWELAAEVVGWKCDFLNYEKAIREKYGLGFLQPHGSGSYWQWSKKFAMLVFDECHRCSGSTSATGKLLRSATKAAQYVVALSATAAENPLHLKNLGTALGLFQTKNYYNWLLRHGVKPGVFGGFTPSEDPEVGDAAMAKIHDAIFPKRGARMRRSLIPNFPQTLIDVKLLDVEDADLQEHVDLVHKMEEDGVRSDELEKYHEVRQDLDMLLVDDVVEMVLESLREGRRVVLFPKYIATLDELVRRLDDPGIGARVGYIDGRQVGPSGEAERTRFKEGFQYGLYNVLVVNQQAGGAGLSLHDPTGRAEVDTYIWPTDSGRMLKQILGRVQRDGGGFSRQFLLGFAGTAQEGILLKSIEKIRRIDALNDRDLDSLRFI